MEKMLQTLQSQLTLEQKARIVFKILDTRGRGCFELADLLPKTQLLAELSLDPPANDNEAEILFRASLDMLNNGMVNSDEFLTAVGTLVRHRFLSDAEAKPLLETAFAEALARGPVRDVVAFASLRALLEEDEQLLPGLRPLAGVRAHVRAELDALRAQTQRETLTSAEFEAVVARAVEAAADPLMHLQDAAPEDGGELGPGSPARRVSKAPAGHGSWDVKRFRSPRKTAAPPPPQRGEEDPIPDDDQVEWAARHPGSGAPGSGGPAIPLSVLSEGDLIRLCSVIDESIAALAAHQKEQKRQQRQQQQQQQQPSQAQAQSPAPDAESEHGGSEPAAAQDSTLAKMGFGQSPSPSPAPSPSPSPSPREPEAAPSSPSPGDALLEAAAQRHRPTPGKIAGYSPLEQELVQRLLAVQHAASEAERQVAAQDAELEGCAVRARLLASRGRAPLTEVVGESSRRSAVSGSATPRLGVTSAGLTPSGQKVLESRVHALHHLAEASTVPLDDDVVLLSAEAARTVALRLRQATEKLANMSHALDEARAAALDSAALQRRVAELEEQNMACVTQVEHAALAQADYDGLSVEVQMLRQSRESERLLIADKDEECQRAHAQADRLAGEVEMLQDMVRELSSQIQVHSAEKQEWDQAIAARRAEQQALREARLAVHDLQTEAAAMRLQTQASEARLQAALDDLSRQRVAFDEADAERLKLQSRCAALEKTVSAQQQRLEDAGASKATAATLQTRVRMLERRNDTLEKGAEDAHALHGTIHELREALRSQEVELAALHEELDAARRAGADAARLREEARGLQRQAQQLAVVQRDLDAVSADKEALQAEQRRVANELEEARVQAETVPHLQGEIARLQGHARALNESLTATDALLDERSKAAADAQRELSQTEALKAQLKHQQEETADLRQRVQELMSEKLQDSQRAAELDDARSEISSLNEQLALTAGRAKDLAQRLAAAEQERFERDEALRAAETRLAHLGPARVAATPSPTIRSTG